MTLGLGFDSQFAESWLRQSLDLGLVIALTFLVLLAVRDRRTLWMVRGLIVLMVAAAIAERCQFRLLNFVLDKLVVGAALAMSVVFQSEFRRFLEQLGRGNLLPSIGQARRVSDAADRAIDRIVDAVKELSQQRIGALMILETNELMDERDFAVPGVKLDAELSKELIQTIFQNTTLLHDGAVFIRGDRVVAAGVILPLSDRTASRQLGTRHRAAMGITERTNNCVCIVVSEETGSISLAESGILDRPLTSSKLKELLEIKFAPISERESVAPNLRTLGRKFSSRGMMIFRRLLQPPKNK
ncbi:diadenylate cyclase CdaA [Chamaesiphon sp. VAR_48_metabat_135_sub]|uniref:diadenylate cyclase CdaA n=1 Tax=Chamaesiphon sp. VAR_48_metabat_135_sub TaxID=2964699 RepID=UPI00286BBDE2|nr:diadenylate cyclase CdaA [Chamaesiphon sp. VAR_48_metabat_135_sub]